MKFYIAVMLLLATTIQAFSKDVKSDMAEKGCFSKSDENVILFYPRVFGFDEMDIVKDKRQCISNQGKRTSKRLEKSESIDNAIAVLLERKFRDKKIARGYVFKKNDSFSWSVGNSFEQGIQKNFKKPAQISFRKTAGNETEESVLAAIKLTHKVSENWENAYGYSIEKFNNNSESRDIRRVHLASEYFNCTSPMELGVSYTDNFKQGNESIAVKLKLSPLYANGKFDKSVNKNNNNCVYPSSLRRTNAWLDFNTDKQNNKISNENWNYFVAPFVELEYNDQIKKPYSLNGHVNDDDTYLSGVLNFGLRKKQFKFSYTGTRRFNLSGGDDLSFHDYSFNYFFTKNEGVSIGLSARQGRRPEDMEKLEEYVFTIGVKL